MMQGFSQMSTFIKPFAAEALLLINFNLDRFAINAFNCVSQKENTFQNTENKTIIEALTIGLHVIE
jgi:hypothetical protein